MSSKLVFKIGSDPELMVKYKGEYIYPKLGRSNEIFESGKEKIPIISLRHVGYDEFGHCAEIRPNSADTGKQLVLNIIDTMSELPECFKYYTENVHNISHAYFKKLIRASNGKPVPKCLNVYGKDILDECPASIEAINNGQRLLSCGCHMHISCTMHITDIVDKKEISLTKNVELPAKYLTRLFDTHIFESLSKARDDGFNVGRYRSIGFYETKSHGGFEYRSLGASTLTPKRILLVANMMLDITKHVMTNINEVLFNESMAKGAYVICDIPKEITEMATELSKTKQESGNIRDLWVKF